MGTTIDLWILIFVPQLVFWIVYLSGLLHDDDP
jgi:hypothetical protein